MRRAWRQRLRKGAILGLAAGLVGAGLWVTPFGAWLEEELGLSWLFQLRGARPAPAEVAVVSIERDSSDWLGVPNRPERWPRVLHARLIDRLAAAGVSTIAFDIHFGRDREPEGDAALAAAMAAAGNVVLFEYVHKEVRPLPGADGGVQGTVTVEQAVPPIPLLAEAAAGLAPFALPKVPVRVSQIWLFKPESGDAPTLPAVALALHRHAAQRALEAAAGLEPAGRVDQRVRALRVALQRAPQGSLRPQAARDAALHALYAGPRSRYLNFYGPPRSIPSVPYHRVIEGDLQALAALRGKAVFVGFAEDRQPEQKDGFYTVFSQDDTGLDIAGVEIAATAFANLLDGSALRPLSGAGAVALLLGWGLLLGLVLRQLGPALIVVAATLLGLLYLWLALRLFAGQALWMPLALALLVQLPLAALGALAWGFREAHEERLRIRQAFGFHLPPAVVEDIAHRFDPAASSEHVYGICLASDAEAYTPLAERLQPAALREHMNAYYQALFGPVRRAGGVVADVVGDAMVTIWAAGAPESALRERALRAALAVLDAADVFDASHHERLPTRLGLHCGELVLGHVGALDHFEYRAIGDIVNTATRLESLCKRLQVRAVASAQMLEGVGGLVTRELGSFVLAGKTQPLVVHELCRAAGPDPAGRSAFAAALAAFRAGEFAAARERFAAARAVLGDDGPSRFYLELCTRFEHEPPPAWSGVVHLGTK